jgi:deoxycytidine triphosphate deaminase/intein/homing endonuclease
MLIMGLKPDHWIRKMALEQRMIEPYADNQVRTGVISYGVSSYGYDIRVADEFKIFRGQEAGVVDPKNFDLRLLADFKGEVCTIPPNSFVLARTVEYFRIPRKVLTVCFGKCLAGDTRVIDATSGAYLPISEFVKRRSAATLSLSEWKLKETPVVNHQSNGVKPVYRLCTYTGLEIKATAQHPFQTFEGWLPLKDLKPGDRIAVARTIPIFGNQEWPEHEAILLGLMLSDGQCYTPGHSPRYTTGDPALVKIITKVAREMGGDISPVSKYGYNLVNHRGRGGFQKTNIFTFWLRELGCAGPSSQKNIPQIVYTAQRTSMVKFLQAIFSGDGSIYKSNEGCFLEYSSISEALIDGLRHLLLRFGIFTLKRSRHMGNGYYAYRLQITDKEIIYKFAQNIGFLPGSQKQRRLEEIVTVIKKHPRKRSNFDTLPQSAWELMRKSVHDANTSLRSIGIPRTQPRQSLPYAIALQATQAVSAPTLRALVDSDVVWDTVTAIDPVGEEEVFDLTIPGAHNFVANDIITHNSTYARCGVIVNVTPFEPEWEGFATLEISNTAPLPAKIYANEGIAQVLFFEADEPCAISYADKKGKYQGQQTIVLPK